MQTCRTDGAAPVLRSSRTDCAGLTTISESLAGPVARRDARPRATRRATAIRRRLGRTANAQSSALRRRRRRLRLATVADELDDDQGVVASSPAAAASGARRRRRQRRVTEFLVCGRGRRRNVAAVVVVVVVVVATMDFSAREPTTIYRRCRCRRRLGTQRRHFLLRSAHDQRPIYIRGPCSLQVGSCGY